MRLLTFLQCLFGNKLSCYFFLEDICHCHTLIWLLVHSVFPLCLVVQRLSHHTLLCSLNGFMSKHLGSMTTSVSDLEVHVLCLDLEASYHDILVNRSCAELPTSWCRGLDIILGQFMWNVVHKMALGQFSISQEFAVPVNMIPQMLHTLNSCANYTM